MGLLDCCVFGPLRQNGVAGKPVTFGRWLSRFEAARAICAPGEKRGSLTADLS